MEQYQAAAYLRLSVAGSRAIESESIENQEYIINRFVAECNDIVLVDSYIDSRHSGLIFDRPAFSQMMRDAAEGKINCIIVKDWSRFGRDFVETGRYLQRILPSYGIRFIAVLDDVDTLYKPACDDIVLQIKTAINDEVSREISMKTRNSLHAMRESGLYVGACPIYGYQKSPINKNQLIPDKNTKSVVQQIFKLKLMGMSAARIATQQNSDGVLSPLAYKKKMQLPHPHNGFADTKAAMWSASSVLRILKDETYSGTLVQGKQYKLNYKLPKNFIRPSDEWIRCEKTHDAIVTRYDFEAVQRILLIDTRTPLGDDFVGLFSGLLKCGCCGGSMTRKMYKSGGIVYRYYYCTTGK